MDLSALIFVVLAVVWAAYLIPKALAHHDAMASDRLVEGHTDKVRILSRRRARSTAAVPDAEPVPADDPVVEKVDVVAPEPRPLPTRLPTRASARRAARNRRRVLLVLLLAVVGVAGAAAASYVPGWSVAVPGALVVLFLVVARLSVRAQQRQLAAPRRTAAPHRAPAVTIDVPDSAAFEQPSPAATGSTVDPVAAQQALADEGSLWDPLPMTLPTYVHKAHARRTVRSIELTGMTSSGHDAADSALAEQAEREQADAADGSMPRRRAAGA